MTDRREASCAAVQMGRQRTQGEEKRREGGGGGGGEGKEMEPSKGLCQGRQVSCPSRLRVQLLRDARS